jgi:hypothetical protein
MHVVFKKAQFFGATIVDPADVSSAERLLVSRNGNHAAKGDLKIVYYYI